jgi:hypothetical protein
MTKRQAAAVAFRWAAEMIEAVAEDMMLLDDRFAGLDAAGKALLEQQTGVLIRSMREKADELDPGGFARGLLERPDGARPR